MQIFSSLLGYTAQWIRCREAARGGEDAQARYSNNSKSDLARASKLKVKRKLVHCEDLLLAPRVEPGNLVSRRGARISHNCIPALHE